MSEQDKWLLIDAGNTRIKWCLSDQSGQFQAVQAHNELTTLIEAWQNISTPTQVWLVSVRDTVFNQALSDAVARLWSLPTHQATSRARQLDVINAYAEPERLGHDRWAAMLAAYQDQRTVVLVVNLGTAVTVDAIDATGQHLGGLICPGLRLQQQALLASTDIALPASTGVTEKIELFAHSTRMAIESGSYHSICSLIDRCYRTLHELTGTQPVCYLAGGDAEKIQHALQCPSILQPSLVLKGLALIAASAQTELI